MLKVRTREHTTEKKVFGKTITKSFGQDFVDWQDDSGAWRHIGYLSHTTRGFSGLVNFPVELGEDVAKELTKQKGFKVTWSGAPQDEPEQTEDDDEFGGED